MCNNHKNSHWLLLKLKGLIVYIEKYISLIVYIEKMPLLTSTSVLDIASLRSLETVKPILFIIELSTIGDGP